MLAKVIIENGQKKIQALTADTGTGAPVGSYLYLEKKSNPQGYLYCDGSTFDETVYPALYQYLGTNVLPDWREFSAVGAEQNTTNVYDAQTNPNGVIHDHDVFTQGQAKDDQLQDHVHGLNLPADTGGAVALQYDVNRKADNYTWATVMSAGHTGRGGLVTRGKSRAVFIYIKATSGLTENQQENVLNTINENNSYSTEEHPTGKKWIDGKPIYSKVIDCGALPNSTLKMVAHNIANIKRIINICGIAKDTGDGSEILLPYIDVTTVSNSVQIYYTPTNIAIETAANRTAFAETYITLEYTKTTD